MFTQRYQVLSQNELEMIHDNSLRIMEEIGIVITYEPAREIYAKHGAKVDGNRVYFPRKLVEEAIKLSPSSFTLYARNPKYNVEINTEKVVNAGPYGSPFVTDMDRGRRDATLEDFINIVKICDKLENIDIQSHISCEPQDVSVKQRRQWFTIRSNTVKNLSWEVSTVIKMHGIPLKWQRFLLAVWMRLRKNRSWHLFPVP